MRTISIISTRPGTGKTTVSVNAAKGLEKRGYRVIIHGLQQNEHICTWLGKVSTAEIENIKPAQIVKTIMGVDVLNHDEEKLEPDYYDNVVSLLDKMGYDYLILDTDNDKKSTGIISDLSDTIVACTELAPDDEPQQLAELNRLIENSSRLRKGINLIVPCKIKTNEWTKNSQTLFTIAERVGYENIADLIPCCDRIRMLPCDHKHIWDLKQQNIKTVFDNLVSRLEII
jgi:cellulose biosynthesis protein BcsQ